MGTCKYFQYLLCLKLVVFFWALAAVRAETPSLQRNLAGDRRSAAVGDLPDWLTPAKDARLQSLGFQALEPNSLSYADVEFCGKKLEPPEEQLKVYEILPKHKFLLTIGAQKGGTTFLHQALATHPSFITSENGESGSFSQKELHFFDRVKNSTSRKRSFNGDSALSWYMQQWPKAYVDMSDSERKRTVDFAFHDATPSYLDSIMAPARVKAMLPHARFVLVLRDPVARIYSAFRMTTGTYCQRLEEVHASQACEDTPFDLFVQKLLQSLESESNAFRDCFFLDRKVERKSTWGTCWNCDMPLDVRRGLMNLSVQKSQYAAMLSWWLAFFPPDRFLVLSSEELRNPETRIEALNRVVEHVGLVDVPPFTEEMVSDVFGFVGRKEPEQSPAVAAAAKRLREALAQTERDLATLFEVYWPEFNFTGLPQEY